jgi:hypothetical protein
MSTEANIAALFREFTGALTEVLAENAAVGPARRGRVARAHAAIKSHPGYNEHEFCAAVELAFEQWETLQNAGKLVSTMVARSQVTLAQDSAEIAQHP